MVEVGGRLEWRQGFPSVGTRDGTCGGGRGQGYARTARLQQGELSLGSMGSPARTSVKRPIFHPLPVRCPSTDAAKDLDAASSSALATGLETVAQSAVAAMAAADPGLGRARSRWRGLCAGFGGSSESRRCVRIVRSVLVRLGRASAAMAGPAVAGRPTEKGL